MVHGPDARWGTGGRFELVGAGVGGLLSSFLFYSLIGLTLLTVRIVVDD